MKHVIGNLLRSDYKSLFRSNEFLRVREGLKTDNSDILCRTCSSAEPFGFLSKVRYFCNPKRLGRVAKRFLEQMNRFEI